MFAACGDQAAQAPPAEPEAKAEANLGNTLLKPTSERVTAEEIEAPLGFGMHGDLDADGDIDTASAPGPIAALMSDVEDDSNDEAIANAAAAAEAGEEE